LLDNRTYQRRPTLIDTEKTNRQDGETEEGVITWKGQGQ